jgi:PKD repeat protein
MKKSIHLFLAIIITLTNQSLYSQSSKDAAVELWVQVQTSPPTVTLNWVGNGTTNNYSISKKLKTSATWTVISSTNPGSITQYIDNTVTAGTNYEYRVIRAGTSGTVNYSGYGYVNTGIEIPTVENRGKLILLIANNFSTTLAPEITRLQDDLEGDGWEVLTDYVSTSASVTAVKAMITSTYNLDPTNTKALFLLGHIPVPYSGNFGPDAHGDHQGAWPADTYYGDMNGTWTDATTNTVTGLPLRTQNIPGDGKFDQNNVPTGVELQIGRVDLSNMTSFTLTETQLTKNYLDKDHSYRKKITTTLKRAVIDDNFGYINGEAFAANGYKNFAPLVTPTNVIAADYLTTLNSGDYQWSYGCGGGSFTSAGGIGNTTNFTTANTQGIFTVLFGSYFGDWDIANNFLRAPLCNGKTLTNVWAGRPHWALHHMGLGENIGYSTRITQNNTGTYYFSYAQNFIGIALMGDPTLRNDIVAPVSNVVASKNGNNCIINWTASTQTNVLGYNIYMKNDTNKTYTKINSALITANSYTNNCLIYPGVYKYMVRALVLETTPSGTYYNMSEGIADTALNSNNLAITANAGAIYTPTSSVANFTASSTGGTSYNWTFGDGGTSTMQNPVYTYASNGNYTASLTVGNACNSLTITMPVGITTRLSEEVLQRSVSIYPNPANDKVFIDVKENNVSFDIVIFNSEGKVVFSDKTTLANKEINLAEFAKGLYLIQIKDEENKLAHRKLIID